MITAIIVTSSLLFVIVVVRLEIEYRREDKAREEMNRQYLENMSNFSGDPRRRPTSWRTGS